MNDNDKGIKLSRINWAPIRGCSCICEWRCITSWIFARYPVAPWRTATPRLSSQQHEQSWPPVPSSHSRLGHSRQNGGVLSFFPRSAKKMVWGVALQHIMHWYNWIQLGRLMVVLRWCMQNRYVAMKYLDVCCSSSFKSLKLPSKTRLTRHHFLIS